MRKGREAMAITVRLRDALARLRVDGMGEHALAQPRPGDRTHACTRACAPCRAFATFARETEKDWETMARWMLLRYKVPEHVASPEEVVQELLFHAAAFATDRPVRPGRPPKKFDEAKAPLAPYVVWNTLKCVVKVVHRMRGAKMHDPGRSPSRIPRLFSSFGEEVADDLSAVDRMLSAMGLCAAPPQEASVVRQSAARQIVVGCQDEAERTVLRAILAGETFDEGVAILYADPQVRLEFELGSEEAASSLARGVLEMTAQRGDAAE